ncbi:MAG: exo-alpha-sialidase [Bacteroidia bacterium]|nr:exo-alpha-sialidase [Bacteroidia bacterium]
MHLPIVALLFCFQSFIPRTQAPGVSCRQVERVQPAAVNLIFQSTDGGQTWQDVSGGLPENLQADGFFVGETGIYIGAEHTMYYSSTTSHTPAWRKAIYPYSLHATVLPSGMTWKHALEQGGRTNMVESGGVRIRTSDQGILRSTDGGENWEVVISEGGVGIAVERIEGGFAAITYNGTSRTRRVRISADGGKTWQAIDAGLPPSALIASIKQVGGNFVCGHPAGIFRSADRGKTWKHILPAVGDKVFNLFVRGNVVYAVPQNGGC